MAHIQNKIAMKQTKRAKMLFFAVALCSLSCFVYVNVDAATQSRQIGLQQDEQPLRKIETAEEEKASKIQLPVITLVGRMVEVAGTIFELLH